MIWEWDGKRKEFRFSKELITPDVRTYEQMKPVLYDPLADAPSVFYYMYRGLSLPEDKGLFASQKIRYDITVMPAAAIGGEYIKTKGHFHPVKGEHSYPEIYEVLAGEAYYLLQSRKELLAAHAIAGDKVIIPPDYGHVTINPGEGTLVMGNLVSSEFKSDYAPFLKGHGAAFYLLESGWVKNPNYKGVSLHVGPLHTKKVFLRGEGGLYYLFRENPKRFAFLNNPNFYFEK